MKKEKVENLVKKISLNVVRLADQNRKWERGWTIPTKARFPFNPFKEKRYSGLNAFILITESLTEGFWDPRWLTYKQTVELGEKLGKNIHVREGSKATCVTRPNVTQNKKRNATGQEKPEDGENDDTDVNDEASEEDAHPVEFFSTYNVFNGSQIEGMPPLLGSGAPTTINVNDIVEKFVACSGIEVKHVNNAEAAYSSRHDCIYMPMPGLFKDDAQYYSTLLHEFYHATGYRERENRLGMKPKKVGYPIEEVRAEMFSLLASTILDIPVCFENSAKYVNDWHDALPKESGYGIFTLASEASKILILLGEFMDGKKPSANWYPEKKKWRELLSIYKKSTKGLPGFA